MSGKQISEEARAAFDTCLAGADEYAAAQLAARLLQDGVDGEEVLLGLVAPAQVRVGERWAAGEWTVAQEHAATHVSGRTVDAVAAESARLGRHADGAGSSGGVLAACSDGEWHVLPARILCEVLRMRGFGVRFLGGHVPAAQLISDIHQNGPEVLALSCTLTMNLPLAHRQIEVSRQAGVPVLTGGTGFGPAGVWAYALGADAHAADARAAAGLLHSQWPPPLRGEPTVQADGIEAYAQLTRRRRELLGQVMEDLCGRFPDMRVRSGEEREADEEVLGHLLDNLAAGVFVGDSRILTGQLAFATAYLTARAVQAPYLDVALGSLAEQVRDSPLVLHQVVAGQRWLTEGPGRSRG